MHKFHGMWYVQVVLRQSCCLLQPLGMQPLPYKGVAAQPDVQPGHQRGVGVCCMYCQRASVQTGRDWCCSECLDLFFNCSSGKTACAQFVEYSFSCPSVSQ